MNTDKSYKGIRIGLALVLLGLIFGIGLGISFGLAEDAYKDFIAAGITAHPDVHAANSSEKIWRYAQRAHFHAVGIGAFSLGLLLLINFSGMQAKIKTVSSVLIGLSGCYPLSWYTMFLLAPAIGTNAAHHHLLTELFTYIGVGGLLCGMLVICANIFSGLFAEK